MSEQNLGAPRTYVVPAVAHRQNDVYRDGVNTAPRTDDVYKQYKFLGRLPGEAFDEAKSARDAAQERFGPRARVFRVARYWVCYEVQ
jgi:hypothetical protein